MTLKKIPVPRRRTAVKSRTPAARALAARTPAARKAIVPAASRPGMHRLFTSIRTPRAFEGVAEQIRQAIFKGKLVAGDRLPPERELARVFGVSRTALREALRVLERSGLLRIHHGAAGGLFVTDNAAEAVGQAFMTLFHLNGLTVADFYQARRLLEVPVTEEVARQRRPKVLALLEQNLSDYAARPDVTRAREFHLIIAGALGNRLIEQLMQAMANFAEIVGLDQEFDERVWTRVLKDHRQIYEAIRDGDPEQTRKLMSAHLRLLETFLSKAG